MKSAIPCLESETSEFKSEIPIPNPQIERRPDSHTPSPPPSPGGIGETSLDSSAPSGGSKPNPPLPPGVGRGEGVFEPEVRHLREVASVVERLSRLALALVWVYEGLVPKILFTTEMEVDLVARSGLYWPTPRAMLLFVGACEIAGGLWLLTGRATRTAAALSVALLGVVGTMCAVLEPSILYHPFGGLSKNLGLLACAAAVYLLAPFKPGNRKPSRPRIQTTKGVV